MKVFNRNRMNGRFYLAGLVSSGARVCGTARGAVYVNVTHYLPWIHRAKLHDLIEDYKETKNLPYDKMDSSVFGAIFEYLAKEDSLF
jgi:secreted trypsin-like serine protease